MVHLLQLLLRVIARIIYEVSWGKDHLSGPLWEANFHGNTRSQKFFFKNKQTDLSKGSLSLKSQSDGGDVAFNILPNVKVRF